MGILEYPVTREIKIPFFKFIIFPLALLYVVIITVINVYAVGYEPVFQNSFDFNNTAGVSLWYEKFVPHVVKDYFPDIWKCEPTVIKVNDGLATNTTGLFNYQLSAFFDPNARGVVSGMNYANYLLQNCSVQNILIELVQPPLSSPVSQINLQCNTSFGQTFYFLYSDLQNTLVNSNLVSQRLTQEKTPLNITSLVFQWISIAQSEVLTLLTTPNNDLSSVVFSYSANNPDGSINSPANDFWSLNITYGFLNSQVSNTINITFLSNGTVDTNRTSTTDLQSSINIIPSTVLSSDASNFWAKLNWIYVSLFWTVLYDLGQIAPTGYVNQSNTAVTLPSTNNIFVNPGLFNAFSTVLKEDILPDLNQTISLQNFIPVNGTNRLYSVPTTLLQNYSCTQRKRKEFLSILISVMATDISFILFAYGVVTWLAEMWEKRNKGRIDANYCEGCRKLMAQTSSSESMKYL